LTNRKNEILTVPLSAVTTREKDDEEKESKNVAETRKEVMEVVFINDHGVAKMTEVKTGISDFDNIEIVEGMEEGMELVSGPFLTVSKRLKDGDKIKKSEKKPNRDSD
jgi:HlyD family secretion protein